MDEEAVVARVRKAIKKAKSNGMTDSEILSLAKEKGFVTDASLRNSDLSRRLCSMLNCLMFKVYPFIFFFILVPAYPLYRLMAGYACLLVEVSPFGEAVTPIVDCAMCEGVTSAPRITNLSMDDFIRNHAYTSRPILVEGAVLNWSAVEVFSYDFFKEMYLNLPESLEEDHNSGQFFAYGSNIMDLKEFFSLPREVATMETEKWYIGWSTFNPLIGEQLKEHVGVPYFIPPQLADSSVSWIFMGSPGPGANIHIDMVGLSSWQAQLVGKKTWSLYPPPECEHICQSFNVTMNTGDVLIVDTNKWYHQTYIHPGSISITIGSEFR